MSSGNIPKIMPSVQYQYQYNAYQAVKLPLKVSVLKMWDDLEKENA